MSSWWATVMGELGWLLGTRTDAPAADGSLFAQMRNIKNTTGIKQVVRGGFTGYGTSANVESIFTANLSATVNPEKCFVLLSGGRASQFSTGGDSPVPLMHFSAPRLHDLTATQLQIKMVDSDTSNHEVRASYEVVEYY